MPATSDHTSPKEPATDSESKSDVVPMAEPMVSAELTTKASDHSEAAPQSLVTLVKKPDSSNAGQLILQWLTYALWGWTILVTALLTVWTLNVLTAADTNSSGYVDYVLAAVLVLLPASLITNYIYAKAEPAIKTGGALVIMVIHAVLFALLGIAALIFLIFALVHIVTNGMTSSDTVAIVSAIIVGSLFLALFLRTLKPTALPWLGRVAILFMSLVIVTMVVLGFAGPIMQLRAGQGDRLVDANLSTIVSAIDTYTYAHSSLPTTLKDLPLSGNSAKVVAQNLLQYLPNTKPSVSSAGYTLNKLTSSGAIYFYQLCFNYKQQSQNYYPAPTEAGAEPQYSSYVLTDTHPSGHYCYYLSTSAYYGNAN